MLVVRYESTNAHVLNVLIHHSDQQGSWKYIVPFAPDFLNGSGAAHEPEESFISIDHRVTYQHFPLTAQSGLDKSDRGSQVMF